MLITLFEQSKGRNLYRVFHFKRPCAFYLTLLSHHQTARNLQDDNFVEEIVVI